MRSLCQAMLAVLDQIMKCLVERKVTLVTVLLVRRLLLPFSSCTAMKKYMKIALASKRKKRSVSRAERSQKFSGDVTPLADFVMVS